MVGQASGACFALILSWNAVFSFAGDAVGMLMDYPEN